MKLLTFIIVFNIIVFIHELGHFLVAKKNKILVHEFSLGMGPAILKKKYGDTLYAFRALPIGGYVKMEGEDDESDLENSFNNKSPWARLSVIFAGPFMNFLLTIVIFILLFTFIGVPDNSIGSLVENYPAEQSGLEAGDKIISVNGIRTDSWKESSKVISGSGESVEIKVLRGDKELSFNIDTKGEEGSKVIGIYRGSSKNFFKAIPYAFSLFFEMIGAMFQFFKTLILGKVKSADVAGPVGLYVIIGQAAESGISAVLYLMAYISLNLGVINLLPIPALDGGRILFIIIEIIRGKPVSKEREGLVHAIGFMLLIALIILITYNDIAKLF